jgi:glutamine synthetase
MPEPSRRSRAAAEWACQMTGSPNLTIVPDPRRFACCPRAWRRLVPATSISIPAPCSIPAGQLAAQQLGRLADRMGLVVGPRSSGICCVTQDRLSDDNIGAPGVRGRPIGTCAPEPGYSYHCESNMDQMQPVLTALAQAFEKIELPLRSVENEWGPGQVECTFAARDALTTADNLLLFRTATKQICRRMGHFATFMCRPGPKGYYSSGWHLHQSVIEAKSGTNLFSRRPRQRALSARSQFRRLIAATRRARDCVHHADRQWIPPFPAELARARSRDLVLRSSRRHDPRAGRAGRPGDAAREPRRRAGRQSLPLCGVADRRGPRRHRAFPRSGPAVRRALRVRLPAAAEEPAAGAHALAQASVPPGAQRRSSTISSSRNEAGRFARWLEENGVKDTGEETTDWEQREYFDFF